MIDTLLNAEERKIYRLSRIERMKEGEILKKMSLADPTYSIEKFKDTLKKVDRKVYVSARYEALSSLSEKYLRVLKVLKDYFEEKNKGKKHVFNIDFSDIYVYLNPWELARDNAPQIISDNNVGSIYYMLNSDHKINYCMLPPAIWESINRLDATQKLLEQTPRSKAHSELKAFHKLINDWDGKNSETFSTELMNQYKSMGKFLKILTLASKGDLDERSKDNCSTTKKLLTERIKRVDDFVKDVGQVKIHENTYERAFDRLKRRRPDEGINNSVDSANVAITYDLTEKNKGMRFRLVSHSKHPSAAFRNISFKGGDHHEVFLACCPQFVSTLIMAENNQLNGIDPHDFKKCVHFNESIRVLEGIKNQYNDLKYGQIYLRSWNMDGHTTIMEKTFEDQTVHMENTLNSLYNHLMDLPKFRDHIYPTFIEQIININSGKDVNLDGAFKKDIGDLMQLFENEERYKRLVEDATDIIHGELKETYKGLGNYVTGKYEHLLTPDMRLLLDELNKEM